jgi:Kef-type K+ transport system membrane component KefB
MAVMFGRTSAIDLTSLVVGGLFMGVNFLLLSFGVAYLLTPMASKGRIKAGVGLLVLKIAMFLGLLITVFFHFNLDAISFALGFSTLIVAIFFETLRRNPSLRT